MAKFNLKEIKTKDYLLSEAISRVNFYKDSMFQKQAMPVYRGQKHLRNSQSNLKKIRFDPGPRIQQIAAEIEQNFAKFLKERVTIDSKSRLVSIKPGFSKENLTQVFEIKPISPSQQPGLDPNQEITGVREKGGDGSIYFRYGFTRTLLPDEDTREGEECLSVLDEFQEKVIDVLNIPGRYGGVFDILDFASELEKNRIAIMPGFHTGPGAADKSEIFIHEQANTLSPADPNVQYLKDLVLKTQDFERRYPQLRYLPMSTRHPKVAYSSKLKGEEILSLSISNETNESTLGRLITYKIASGYTLDKDALWKKSVIQHIQKQVDGIGNMGNIKEYSLILIRKWRNQYQKMLRVYKNAESWVKSHEKIQREFELIERETNKPQHLRDDKLIQQIHRMYGWDYTSKTKGTKPNPASLQVYTGDDKIDFNYFHMQLILQNITILDPSLKRVRWDIKANQYIDPAASIQVFGDGFSDHPAKNSIKEKSFRTSPYIPPMVEEDGKIRFDHESTNMGITQLQQNGNGIVEILNYGPIAKQLIQGLLQMDLSDIRNEKLKKILYDYPRTFLGAEILYQWLRTLKTSEQLKQETTFKFEHRAGTPFDPDTTMKETGETAFDYLKEYGYYLSKLMEIIRAVAHTSDMQQYDLLGKEPLTMYGGTYSTSSGVGGGGQILISVRYAYPCSLEQLTGGNEELQQKYKAELRKKSPHDPRIPQTMDPLRQTEHFPVSPERRMIEAPLATESLVPSSASQPLHATYVGNMSYFLGLSSTLPGTGGQSMMKDSMTAKSWQECLYHLKRMYSIGNVDIAEANDDFLADVSKDLSQLEESIQLAIAAARDSVDPNIIVDVVSKEDFVDRIEAGMPPIQTSNQTVIAPEGEIVNVIPGISPPIETPQSVTTPQLPENKTEDFDLDIVPPSGEPKASTETQNPIPILGDRVTKDQGGRKLIKNPSDKITRANLENKVIKLSDTFDNKGLNDIADQLDSLLNEIITME